MPFDIYGSWQVDWKKKTGKMKIAVVGATGLVGTRILKVLEERNFPVSQLLPVASEKSRGKTVIFKGRKYPVVTVEEAIKIEPTIAIFSAGGQTSLDWAPAFAKVGTFVIDNSSAWRLDPMVPLVIPEINSKRITSDTKIIANPNCSTIQMLMVLAPLHREFNIKRIVVSTYQSVTGTGVRAVKQLEEEESTPPQARKEPRAYPHEIFRNCLPHCDQFLDNGYTKEEMKLLNETRKILEDDNILLTATAVRVPVVGGHSESVNVEFTKSFDMAEILVLLSECKGVEVLDDPANNSYPMPIMAEGSDLVFVGRIRQDNSCDKGLNLWIVSDNLRKGAATNAVQIAEYLIEKKFVKLFTN